mmetsp:Transcript_38865/g.58383  ORF Transcript_38865/g.58383 Transcript_38865/m.58383 type:complete len:376 (-) Transcript_38865:292-1419(-)
MIIANIFFIFLSLTAVLGANYRENAFVVTKLATRSAIDRCTESEFWLKSSLPACHSSHNRHLTKLFKRRQILSPTTNSVTNSERDEYSSTLSDTRRRFLVSLGVASITTLAKAQNSYATITDPKTGISFPSEGEIENSIPSSWDDSDNPFESAGKEAFARLDSSPDSIFYSDPRFVEHVDTNIVQTMTSYLSDGGWALRPGDEVLDLCSSWTSHIDVKAKEKLGLKRVSGLGMNAEELKANTVLTDWVVKDLNTKEVKLPYDDSCFDVVLCQLSIDYLTHPLEVMQEVGRVLRPGGRVVILFSNRLFLSKAVGLWTGADDVDHAYLVGSYLHYSKGGFENIKAQDLSTRKGKGKDRPVVGDPLYAVTAIRSDKTM